MDGIVRDTEELDARLSDHVQPLATAMALVLVALLVVALTSEVLRRADAAPRLVALLDRVVPASVRRLAAAAVTVSVAVLGPATAHAADTPVRGWLAGETTTTTATASSTTTPVATEEGLIERTSPPPSRSAAPEPLANATPAPTVPEPDRGNSYVVVEGDCLWSIAAARLGPEAGNPAVDRAWRAVYAMNRAAIGDDPNLIFPGLELQLPPLAEIPAATP